MSLKPFNTSLKMFMSRAYVSATAWGRRFRNRFDILNNKHIENVNRRTSALVIIFLIIGGSFYFSLLRPDQQFPTPHYSTIEKGVSLGTVALQLQNEHVITNARMLTFAVRLLGGGRSVRAGDYLFARPLGTLAVARIITTGVYGLTPVRIAIPEGATIADMATIYKKYLFKFNPKRFTALALPYEGYLYPDTYYFLPNMQSVEIIRAMNANFKKQIQPFAKQIDASPYTFHQIITLASIVQKEAWKKKDQKMIAGILYNRLKKDMRLQVDATFTYTHNKGTYQITIKDLTDKTNPYNTYVHKGLPPGPIGAPGYNALNATLNPTPSKYLYYLSDRKGNTYYSRTYTQHLAKKRRYVD